MMRPSVRPYAKWERLSVAALVLVAFIAVVAPNHKTKTRDETRSASHASTSSTAVTSTTSSPATTTTLDANALPKDGNAQFTPVNLASVDFTGRSLNKSVWAAYSGPGNQGVGTRDPSAISVSNGEAAITAKGTVSGGMAQNFSQTYGRWSVRARMEKGQGYGPAILLWPDSENWPIDKEIDMVEIPDGNRTYADMTVHYGATNLQQAQTAFADFTQWHTYTVDWLPDRIVFYIDGVQKFRITDPDAIPTVPHHLAIQNDVGSCGSFIGCTNSSTPSTVALHVDSVRVFSYNG